MSSSASPSRLQAFLAGPSLDTLLGWCDEHCSGVRDGRVYKFPADLVNVTSSFWVALCDLVRSISGRAYDAAVFYPGRDASGQVLPENNLADALHGKLGRNVFYADKVRTGRIDENIAAAVVGCRTAVFVVSGVWFERKWCLAEMLLAMASGGDDKCKVIEYGAQFRAELLPLHRRVVRERFDSTKRVTEEVMRLAQWVLNAPGVVVSAPPSGSRPVRAFVLSSAIDADAYAKRLAPANRDNIVPPTELFDLSVRVLTDIKQADAPVLVIVKLPAVVDGEVQADVDALFESLRQPPAQVVPAALFDASPSERLLLSQAAIVDAGFRPDIEPAAELVSGASKDVMHRTATSVKSYAKRLAIAYVPEDDRAMLLKAVSEQWIAHTVGERAFKFAFLKLHNRNGDATRDRIDDWDVFEAAFAVAVASTSSKHYLVLPSHVGALVACLVRGGAWARYLEWLAKQDGEVSVLGLAPRVLDKAALARLAALGTDSVECFASAGELETRVGASAWSDAANWIGGATARSAALEVPIAVAPITVAPVVAAASSSEKKKRGAPEAGGKQSKSRRGATSTTAASSAAAAEDQRLAAAFATDQAQRAAVFKTYVGDDSKSEFEQCMLTLIETVITAELPLLAGAVVAYIRVTEGAVYDDVWIRLLDEYCVRGANAIRGASNQRERDKEREFFVKCWGRIVFCCRQADVSAEKVAELLSGSPARQDAANAIVNIDMGDCLRRLDAAAAADATPQVLESLSDSVANTARFDELKQIVVESAGLSSLPVPPQVEPPHEAGERRVGLSDEQLAAGKELAAKISEIAAGKSFENVSVCFVVPPRLSLVEQTKLRVEAAGLADALVVSPSQSAAEEAKLFTFAGEALMDPGRLFVLVVDECHWGIESTGLLCTRFLHQPTLLEAAKLNGNVVSVHVSATPENNLVVPIKHIVRMPRAAAYKGFDELCLTDSRRLVDAAWTKDRKKDSDAKLCIDYARALTARAAAFAKAPTTASGWTQDDGALSASEKVADELLRRWYVNEPGLVVLRLPTADAAKAFTEHLANVVRELGLQNREHDRRPVEVLYELGAERNWGDGADTRSKNYERLLENRLAFFVLVSMCQMGDTFPPSLFAYDTRARFYTGSDGKLDSSRSTFLQDVGRAFGYGRDNVRVIFGRDVGALVRDKRDQMFAKIDAYVDDGADPLFVAEKRCEKDRSKFKNMFKEPADAVLASARVILRAEPQCGKTGAYLEAVRLVVEQLGLKRVEVAEPAKPTLSDIEWQLPSREFVERVVNCEQLGFGKYHERVQRMRVQLLLESATVDDYALKVARVECIPTDQIVPAPKLGLPEWRQQSGAFRFESAQAVARFLELIDFDSDARGVLKEWALLQLDNDGAGKPLQPGQQLQPGVWYTLDAPYRSTTNLFVFGDDGAPLASAIDVAAPPGWSAVDGGRAGRLLFRESDRARFAAKDKAWCFVVSRRSDDTQLRELAQYDVGERPLVIVVVSSQFVRYLALVDNSPALQHAALLVLPAQLSAGDVKDVLPELESVGWSHKIDEHLSAGYPRLVVQLFAREHGLELIHMLDDNIDSDRLFRRRRGLIEMLALDAALTALERCVEPTERQKRDAADAKLELHPNARGKIVMVGCWRSPRHGAMQRAVTPVSTARPYSMVLLNAKLARDEHLWYRPKPVWEDVDLIDEARAKRLAVIKMNGLAHFKTFFNNLNRRRAPDDEERHDDCDDEPQPVARVKVEEMAEDSIVVTEETLLDAPVSEAVYEIVSDSGRRAALIALFLHGAAKRVGQASVRVRIPAAQEADLRAIVERVLIVAAHQPSGTSVEMNLQ